MTGAQITLAKHVYPVLFSAAIAVLLSGCSGPPDEDPSLEQELSLQLAAAAQVTARFGAGDDHDRFDRIYEAKRPLQQFHTACAVRWRDGARVILVDGHGPIVEGPAQGPWFNYAWNRAGC